jgi:hypothetical protein
MVWASWQKTVKLIATNWPSRRRGGGRGKVTAFIRGDLPGCHPSVTAGAARRRWTRQKSAEAIVPAGSTRPGRAEHQESESMDRLDDDGEDRSQPMEHGPAEDALR